jgi:hypothetical protein
LRRAADLDKVVDILNHGFDAKLLLKDIQESGDSQSADGNGHIIFIFFGLLFLFHLIDMVVIWPDQVYFLILMTFSYLNFKKISC